MEKHITPRPAPKPAAEILSIEDAHAHLSIVVTFNEAAGHFVNNLWRLASSPNADASMFKADAEHASKMISEIEARVRNAKEILDAFIDAAPADHLWAERAVS